MSTDHDECIHHCHLIRLTIVAFLITILSRSRFTEYRLLAAIALRIPWATACQIGRLLESHKDRQPGKITLMRGLSRLLERLATQAMPADYVSQHQGPPPKIMALLHGREPSSRCMSGCQFSVPCKVFQICCSAASNCVRFSCSCSISNCASLVS